MEIREKMDNCYGEVEKLVNEYGFWLVFHGLKNQLIKRLPQVNTGGKKVNKLWWQVWNVYLMMDRMGKKVDELIRW
jgi:hypothetical protein